MPAWKNYPAYKYFYLRISGFLNLRIFTHVLYNIYMGESFQDYSWIQDLESDFT